MSNSCGNFSTLANAIAGRDFARDDLDRARRADEFAELAGDAADPAGVIADQRRRAAIMFRHLAVPFFLGVLHRHLRAAEEHVLEMPHRDRHAAQDRRQVEPFRTNSVWSGGVLKKEVAMRQSDF